MRSRPQLYRWTALYAEVLAVLAGAVALTLALSLAVTVALVFLVPLGARQGSVDLAPSGADTPRPAVRLGMLEDLRRAGVATSVQVTGTRSGGQRLILRHVESAGEARKQVAAALLAAGYEPRPLRLRPELDPEALMREPAVFVPGIAIQALVFITVGWVLARWRVRQGRAAFGSGRALALGLGGGVAACGVAVGGGFLLEWLGWPVQEQPLLAELLGNKRHALLLAPWIVLAAPIAEEVFFRGYLFRFVTQRAGLAAGLGVSSALFALVHLNPSGFLIYLAIGGVFAGLYARSARLLTPIVAHVTYNAILMVAIGLGLT